MDTRRLGSTDLHLSEVGFGAWAIGGGGWAFGWGPQEDREAVEAIHTALDLGVNWIDTAAVYGLGHSEEIVARALEGRRSQVIVATKCSLVWDEQGNISSRLDAGSVRRECEDSLRRLRTDWIDLYQIHWPNDDPHIEEGWETLARLVDEGKVRCGGVSNFSVEHMRRAQRIHPIASLQPPYNMLRRDIEGPIFDYCREHRIGMLAYSPMASGLLTGRFDIERVAEDDWRRRAQEFQEPNLSANLALVDGLRPIAEKYDKTPGQLAIAWVLRRNEITSAIVGARRPEQIRETVGGAGWTFSDDDREAIEHLLEERRQRIEAG